MSVLSNFTLLINCRSRRPSRGDLKSFRGKEASCDERAGIQRERLLFRDNFEGNFTGKGIQSCHLNFFLKLNRLNCSISYRNMLWRIIYIYIFSMNL